MDVTQLIQAADTKILLVVMDGLGGYADGEHGTELEEATTPHLDRLAAEGTTGLVEPVGPGITPGSGPGHLGLFGYDPERFELGRGALSAAGLDFELRPGDVAARGNLCTLGADGTVADRRAGRVPDDEAAAVVAKLQEGVHVDGAEVELHCPGVDGGEIQDVVDDSEQRIGRYRDVAEILVLLLGEWTRDRITEEMRKADDVCER